jgi:small subunit ribosomal protein S6
MSDYELAVVTSDDLPEKDKKELFERLEKKISEAEGKVKEVEEAGKRSLAFPIKKHNSANFTFIQFVAPAKIPSEVRKELNISEAVLRSLLIKKAAKTKAKAVKKQTKEN